MKKPIKVISVLILMFFSFYYTEKIAILVQNNTPLKKEIMAFKEHNHVSSINAQINGSEIVPGINGLDVNVEKSYKNMKTYNAFIEKSIVYDEVKPNISVNDYPNKIISSGNPQRKAISILISKNNNYIDYLNKNNINYSFIDENNYCIIIDEDNCSGIRKKVKVSFNLNNTNFIKNIDEVKKGSIIYIDDDLDPMFIDVLIKHIKFYNLNILKLNDHLSENNHI